MKKIVSIICIFVAFLAYTHTNAFEMKTGEDIIISETVIDDLYIAGGRIKITAPIQGDLIITGGDISIRSDVRDDVIVAGGNIDISGKTGDDLRIGGGSIQIHEDVEGDLIVGGGDVTIGSGVVIQGDLFVGAARLVIDGDVMGDAKITAGELILNGTLHSDAEILIEEFENLSGSGVIKGNLKYKNKARIQELEDSAQSTVFYEEILLSDSVERGFISFITGYIIVKLIGLFVFSLLIYFYFEKILSRVSNKLNKNFWKSFFYGFLIITLMPIAIIILFVTVIGTPFALFLLFLYIFIFVFLDLINVVIIASWLINIYKIEELYKKIFIIGALTIGFGIINGIDIIVGFFSLGAITLVKIRILRYLQKI